MGGPRAASGLSPAQTGEENTVTQDTDFTGREPTRDEVDHMQGPVLLEFGAAE
jgi:hypothetical protein